MREMVLQRRLKNEIDKFLLSLKVTLQVKRAKLGNVEFEISPLFLPQIWVDSAASQFNHRSRVAAVKLD
jgi:hypothetical protein